METKVDSDKDYIMRKSYEALTVNETNTLSNFIVFGEDNYSFEIEDYNQKLEYLNGIIQYFEAIEEYEKCQMLLNLKNKIIEKSNNGK